MQTIMHTIGACSLIDNEEPGVVIHCLHKFQGRTGPKVIKLFSHSIELGMNFHLLIKTKLLKN